MSGSEKLEAMEKMEAAITGVLGKIHDLSDASLNGCHETVWAAQQDLEHEWVRRKMLAESGRDANPHPAAADTRPGAA